MVTLCLLLIDRDLTELLGSGTPYQVTSAPVVQLGLECIRTCGMSFYCQITQRHQNVFFETLYNFVFILFLMVVNHRNVLHRPTLFIYVSIYYYY